MIVDETENGLTPPYLQKDQLDAEVREYAQNLEAQLIGEINNSGCATLEDYLNVLDFNNTKRIARIINQLEFIRQHGEIPVDFDKEEFETKYKEMLEEFDNSGKLETQNIETTTEWFKKEIDKLPEVPWQIFRDEKNIWKNLC